VRNKGVP
jgi:hypothetical protein